MKKIILIMGLMLAVSISSVYANGKKVSPVVLESFNKEFASAQEVSWQEGIGYYKAAFSFNGQNMFAYFSKQGELLSIARYISLLQLPIHLFSDLKKDYSDSWITNLFEVNKKEGTHYYVTLENADTILSLLSSNGSEWKTYSKKKKL